MKNNTFEEIWKELKKAKKVLMTLHYRPDGDSLGSCAAMKYVLEKEGIGVKLISRDEIGENLMGFEFAKEVQFGKDIQDENLDNFDLILFLDYPLYDVSEDFIKRLKEKKVINIDHHPSNDYFGNLNHVDSNLPSCCSVLFEMFMKVGVKFDKEIGLRLLLGICTDTGFFLYGDSVDSMKKAIYILEKGKINYEKEIHDIISDEPWERKKVHGIVLSNMKKEEIGDKTIAYSWITKEDCKKQGLDTSDLHFSISCMQDIKDLDLIFVLSELNNGVKGSFRSREFNTLPYSTPLGGGGHKKASAFVIENIKMKDAIKKVLETIKEKGFEPAD